MMLVSHDSKTVYVTSGGTDNVTYHFICPKCAGIAEMYEASFICSDCNTLFHLPACAIPNVDHSAKLDTKEIHKSLIVQSVDDVISKDIVAQDNDSSLTIVYGGDVYKIIKQIREKYGFRTTEDVIRVIFEGFIIFLNSIDKSPSDKVYLIDGTGHKSPNLKSLAWFKNKADNRQRRETNSVTAERFIFTMQKLMNVWTRNMKGGNEDDGISI
jgi:hypothetical protein